MQSVQGMGSVEGVEGVQSVQEVAAYIAEAVPLVDFVVRHATFRQSCAELLRLVLPTWFSTSSEALGGDGQEVEYVECKDGITNKLMRCTHVATRTSILIRAYGKKSELIINRGAELVNFVILSRLGLSPPLHARFTNGFVYGYVEGRAFAPGELAQPRFARLIAAKMAEWHQIRVGGGGGGCSGGATSTTATSTTATTEGGAQLFPTLTKWLNGLPGAYESAANQAAFEAHISVPYLAEQVELLRAAAAALESPAVFCHNDLLSGNIILSPAEDAVTFIDFEYGAPNYGAFDIGNHFCEYAGFACDYSQYPSEADQRRWLGYYVDGQACACGACGACGACDAHSRAAQIDRLYVEVGVFALGAHLYWCLWALVQAHVSEIDFDYMSYAVLRLARYKATRDAALGLVR